jgi:hypothetical protein
MIRLPRALGGSLLAGWLLCILLMLIVCSLLGCAHTQCPECVPDTQYQDVNMETAACVEPPDHGPVERPSKPAPPSEGAPEEELKDWWAAMAEYVDVTILVLEQRIELLEADLEAYREKD